MVFSLRWASYSEYNYSQDRIFLTNALQLLLMINQSHIGFFPCTFRNNSHPDLQLWRQPWKHLERSRIGSDSCRSSNAIPSPVTPDEDMNRGEILMSNALEKLSRAATAATASSSCSSSPFPSFQDSYITSEHCYQKPRAYYPAVEQRLVVETRQGSELEGSMRSTEELLEREQRYGSLLETDKPKSTGISNKVGICYVIKLIKLRKAALLRGIYKNILLSAFLRLTHLMWALDLNCTGPFWFII